MSTPTHDTPPDVPPISGDRSPSFNSWLPAQEDSHSSSTSSWPSGGSAWGSLSSDSTDEIDSHTPSPGQIAHPLPAPPSEPGPSTRPRPPPVAELSDEEIARKAAWTLVAMSRQGFRPRTYASGAVDAAEAEVAGNH